MCLGIPMQVIAREGAYALCEGPEGRRRIDTLLVGETPPGSWLLVFLDSAREVLSSEQAARISDALRALELAMGGEADLDHLFPDLAGREPRLPDHLHAAAGEPPESGESPCPRP